MHGLTYDDSVSPHAMITRSWQRGIIMPVVYIIAALMLLLQLLHVAADVAIIDPSTEKHHHQLLIVVPSMARMRHERSVVRDTWATTDNLRVK